MLNTEPADVRGIEECFVVKKRLTSTRNENLLNSVGHNLGLGNADKQS